MRLLVIAWRGCRLLCPRCGQDRLFRGWLAMWPRCRHCGLKYERESGYYLGAIYFNYGLTAMMVTLGFPLLTFVFKLPRQVVLWGMLAFCLLFPIWFFRYARSLWTAMDQYFDPYREEED